LAKAAEVAARRVLADKVLPSFALLRTLVANEGINRVTRGSYYETTTIGKFSYRELLGGGSVDYSADTVEWNRIRKSIREWANSI
jgi:hypothetical protein